MMRLFGHDQVAVLDGGLPAWKRAGQPVETGEAPAPTPASFVADFRAEKLRGIGDIKRIVAEGGPLIIDARAKGRFDGTAPEPRAGLPSGHMPGAANVPVSEIAGPDGLIKSPEALRALFAAVGVDGVRPVVTSCGSGVTACVLALGLVEAGFTEPAIYDGSWTEWALRPETEKVTR
jgi:thiosulfate/3-mercaptopyruvate sulfurtransferase